MRIAVNNIEKFRSEFAKYPKGCFAGIRGYVPVEAPDAVIDYIYQFGVDYGKITELSLLRLADIMSGNYAAYVKQDENGNPIDYLTARGNAWKCPDGTLTNRKAKDRILVPFAEQFPFAGEAFRHAVEAVRKGFETPHPVDQGYEKVERGLYVKNDIFYVRDALRISRRPRPGHEGTYPTKATLPENALKEAIRQLVPRGRYRAFKLEFDRCESIILGESQEEVE